MNIVNMHDAKTNFSKLINQALKGEEVIIARAGEPLIKLVPYKKEALPQRKGGQLKGLIKISKDFDEPLPQEYLDKFYREDHE